MALNLKAIDVIFSIESIKVVSNLYHANAHLFCAHNLHIVVRWLVLQVELEVALFLFFALLAAQLEAGQDHARCWRADFQTEKLRDPWLLPSLLPKQTTCWNPRNSGSLVAN